MRGFIASSFEWIVCLSEAVMVFLLYNKRFECTQPKKYVALAILPVLATITFVANTASLPWFALAFLSMLIHLIYAFVCFEGSASMKCIWSMVPSTICCISNFILLSLLYNRWGYATLIPGNALRIIAQALYIALNFCILFLILRIKNYNGELPAVLRAATVVLSLAGIAVAMYCLSGLLSGEAGDSGISDWIQCFSILFLSISLIALSGYLSRLYHKHLEIQKELQLTKLESEHVSQVSAMYDHVRGWRHDIKGMLATISNLAEHEEYGKMKKYLREITSSVSETGLIIVTGNPAIDATFSGKLLIADQESIIVEHTISIPKGIRIDEIDICSVIMNLMDNAIEAVIVLPKEERTISFAMIDKGGMLAITVKNPCIGNYNYDEEKLTTTKADRNIHGIGLERISRIVSKHSGFIKIEPMQHSFEINILLPLEARNCENSVV